MGDNEVVAARSIVVCPEHLVRSDYVGAKVVIANLLAAYTVLISVGGYWRGTETAVAIVVTVGLCFPWVLSHRWPRACFGVMLVSALIQLGTASGPIPADVMLFPGLHTLAIYSSSRSAAVGVGALLTVAVAAAARWGGSLSDVGILALAVVAATLAAWSWGRSTATAQRYQEALTLRAHQLERERVHLAQIATAKERERIARDLHDALSHSLAGVLKLSEGTLRAADDLPPQHRETLERIATYCRGSLLEVRRTLSLMRSTSAPDDLDSTLTPRVTDVSDLVELVESPDCSVQLHVDPEVLSVPLNVQEAAYRVVQEALTNVRKHAGPSLSEVVVALDRVNNSLRITIEDDGGVDVRSRKGRGGLGLRGMKQRVESLGGTLSTGPSDLGGFAVRANVPIQSGA